MSSKVLSYRLGLIQAREAVLANEVLQAKQEISRAERELFLAKFGLKWEYFQTAGCILGTIVAAPIVYAFIVLGLAM